MGKTEKIAIFVAAIVAIAICATTVTLVMAHPWSGSTGESIGARQESVMDQTQDGEQDPQSDMGSDGADVGENDGDDIWSGVGRRTEDDKWPAAQDGGSSHEEWPGQSLGYIGPNGEGAVSGDSSGSDEEYAEAIEALDGGWENRVDVEFAEDAPGKIGRYAKGMLSIGFHRSCSEYDAHAIVEGRGGVWVRDGYIFANDLDWASALVYFPDCTTFDALSEAAEELRGLPEVAFVDFETELPDDEQLPEGTRGVEQTYLYHARFDKAWDVVECDHDVTIAVIDRDFDLDHPDLAGNVIFAWDAAAGTVLQADRVSGIGHGTAVAGVASAVSNNHLGIDGLSGNAWLLLITRDDASGNTSADYVRMALLYILGLQNKPDVVNMSFGDYTYRPDFQSAIASLHDNYGVVFTASAGNDASSSPHYPSGYDGVIGVASIGIAGSQSSFSNTGPGVDMCAVGEGIYTTVNPHARIDSLYYSSLFQEQDPLSGLWEYEPIQGTSFAAPQVAAAAALLKAQDPGRGAEDIEELLFGNASHPSGFVDVSGGGPSNNDPDLRDDLGRYGYGVLDAAAAVGWTASGGSPNTGGSIAEMYAEGRR